jgi:predicted RNase H-like nuclease (RuvC/YqgF family)
LNILTKISVVVLVLLVLLFCPVLITLATQQPNFKFLHEADKQQIALLSQNLSMSQVLQQRAMNEEAAEKGRREGAEAKLAGDTAKLTQQLEEEKARTGAQEGRLTSLDMTLKGFQQNLKDMNDRNVKLVADLDAQRAENNRKSEENRRLGDAFNRETLNVQTLQSQVNFLHEQNAQQQEKIAQLETKLASGGGVGGPGKAVEPTPATDITGTVTAVKGDIASINCGAAKGVKVGMVATISRGSEYVCQLEIKNVWTNEAAGVVIKKKLDPSKDDKFDISGEKGGSL